MIHRIWKCFQKKIYSYTFKHKCLHLGTSSWLNHKSQSISISGFECSCVGMARRPEFFPVNLQFSVKLLNLLCRALEKALSDPQLDRWTTLFILKNILINKIYIYEITHSFLNLLSLCVLQTQVTCCICYFPFWDVSIDINDKYDKNYIASFVFLGNSKLVKKGISLKYALL